MIIVDGPGFLKIYLRPIIAVHFGDAPYSEAQNCTACNLFFDSQTGNLQKCISLIDERSANINSGQVHNPGTQDLF